MSKESFQEFVTKLQKDAALQKELRAKFGDPGSGIPGAELAAFAAGKGYTFGVEELKGELSDDQLNAVSGGALFIKFEGMGGLQPTQAKIFLKPDSLIAKHY